MVTSRAFLEKAKLELPDGLELIWIEDVRGTIGTVDRAVALVLACLAPVRLLEKARRGQRGGSRSTTPRP